jgi:hypothetical protein
MIRQAVFGAGFLAVAATVATHHSGARAIADAYRIQFENERVRVERVRYAPGARLPIHAHPAVPTVYVYPGDGDPVIFRHRAADGRLLAVAKRPATRAGSYRLDRGFDELHEVENPSARPSEFLRVVFKAERPAPMWAPRRFARTPLGPADGGRRVEFENDRIRIARLAIGARDSLELPDPHLSSLLIALTPARLRLCAGGSPAELLGLAADAWLPPVQACRLENPGPAEVEALRFEFKDP